MSRRIRTSKIRKKYNKSKMKRRRYTKKYRKVGGAPLRSRQGRQDLNPDQELINRHETTISNITRINQGLTTENQQLTTQIQDLTTQIQDLTTQYQQLDTAYKERVRQHKKLIMLFEKTTGTEYMDQV